MSLSIFLAKLIGIYTLILALDLLLRKREAESSLKDFAASKGLIFYSGSLSLLFGLAIVISHPIYEWNWQGLITLIGYLCVIKGVIRAAFPSSVHRALHASLFKRHWILVLILFVIGIYLTYSGFSAM